MQLSKLDMIEQLRCDALCSSLLIEFNPGSRIGGENARWELLFLSETEEMTKDIRFLVPASLNERVRSSARSLGNFTSSFSGVEICEFE